MFGEFAAGPVMEGKCAALVATQYLQMLLAARESSLRATIKQLGLAYLVLAK